MKINVQTLNFNANEKLISFVNKRLSKLEQFYDQIIFAEVFLKVQKTSEKQNKTVEVLLTVPGDDLIVKKDARTFEEGTDVCIQSLERQLTKRKQKLRAIL